MATAGVNGSRLLRFGLFEVDLQAGELRKNGSRVRLQEQPFQILLALLERPGEVITREELQGRLWGSDTFVDFDHSLNAAIRRLRDALGDSAENPRFVETVARRGYRFLAPVSGPPSASITQSQPVEAGKSRHPRWPWIFGTAAILLAGIVLGFHVGRGFRSAPSFKQRRLTANPPEDPILGAAISPDGKYLAFSDPTGFYLRQVDTGETHSVGLPKTFRARPVSWFPDSTHLVAAAWGGDAGGASITDPSVIGGAPRRIASSDPGASIWDISVLGGSPRRIAGGTQPSVSPDGTKIAYVSGEVSRQQVWVMQADGQNPKRMDGLADIFSTPAWDPNGKKIVLRESKYHPGAEGAETWFDCIDVATGKSEVILSQPGLGESLAWTRDGRLIYSLEEAPPNQIDSNLWFVFLNSETGRLIGSPTRVTSEPGNVRDISVTADGKRVAFSKYTLQPDVYVADILDHGTRLSEARRLTLDERQDYPYAWTPDGKSVIFASDRDGVFHIFRQAIDQTEPELLVGGKEPVNIPRLSPDGLSIFYLTLPKLGEPSTMVRLMRKPLAGGPPQLVLQQDGLQNHQCARRPSTVCVFSTILNGQMKLFTFDPATGASKEIPNAWVPEEAKEVKYAYNWSLSPDGSALVFAQKVGPASGTSTLRLFSMANGSIRNIPVPGLSGIGSLDWAADGKSIWMFTYSPNAKFALLNVTVQGTIRTMFVEDNMTLGWAIPSPDGQHLAFWQASGSANVWMIENF